MTASAIATKTEACAVLVVYHPPSVSIAGLRRAKHRNAVDLADRLTDRPLVSDRNVELADHLLRLTDDGVVPYVAVDSGLRALEHVTETILRAGQSDPATETLALLARDIRAGLIEYGGPGHESNVRIADAMAALSQTEASFPVAWAISEPSLMRQGHHGQLLTSRADNTQVSDPVVLRLRLASPFEVIAQIPPEFLAGSGVGIVTFIALAARLAKSGGDGALMKAATFPIRVSERWAHYRAKAAEWDSERSRHSVAIMENQARLLRAKSEVMRLSRMELLDPEDTQHLLETGESPLEDTP